MESSFKLDNKLVTFVPASQNCLDCFEGLWWSKFPPEFSLNAGNAELFEDKRLDWALSKIGKLENLDILELGPLEGGHSYWLEKNLFPKSITSIEANRLCWLKCLITKEITKLKKTHFLLGDFVSFLKTNDRHYDLSLALGVLYHMTNPLELLSLLSNRSDVVVVWTQFAEREQILKWDKLEAESDGFSTFGYINPYGDGSLNTKFIGGVDHYSMWLTKDSILDALKYYGFKKIILGSTGSNEFGGEMTLVAVKD